MLVINIIILIWVMSDYSSRGGGGCGSCFWALVVLHFGILGILCYLVVRPAKREREVVERVVVQQTAPPPPAQMPAPTQQDQYQPALTPASMPPMESPALQCPNCQNMYERGDRFCDQCGHNLPFSSRKVSAAAVPRILSAGRATDNSIILDHPQVSSIHAKIIIENNQVYIEDCGSTNGTMVNGQRIYGRTPIRQGDRIGFGSFDIMYNDLMAKVG